jgi:hypothetical protein
MSVDVQQQLIAFKGGWLAPQAPAIDTSYYFGQLSQIQEFDAPNSIYISRACTVVEAYASVYVLSINGTAENSTAYIRLNSTTDTAIASTIDTSTAGSTGNTYSNLALSIAVAAGDSINFKWVTPTWATSPTNVIINFSVFATVP